MRNQQTNLWSNLTTVGWEGHACSSLEDVGVEGNGKELYSIVYFEAVKMLLSRFLDWEICDIYLGKQIPRLGNCDMYIR